jgi:hypothetical protein
MTHVFNRRHLALFLPLSLLGLLLTGCGEAEEELVSAVQMEVTELADVGFAQPWGIAVDLEAGVYLVSNMNGQLGEETGNGFISRVSPDGEVLDLNWIDMTGTPRALNSPAGMAIRGDSLFVADLGCVSIFDRETGEDLGVTCLDDVGIITDIDVGPEGSLFVADSGLEFQNGELVATGSDAIYRIVTAEGRQGSTISSGEELGNPRSLQVGPRGIFVTTSGTGELYALTPDGDQTSIFPPSDQALGGLTFLPDGGFVFSSITDASLTMVDAGGQVIDLAEGVPDAQGLAYDPEWNRILVAIPSEDRVLFLDMPADP